MLLRRVHDGGCGEATEQRRYAAGRRGGGLGEALTHGRVAYRSAGAEAQGRAVRLWRQCRRAGRYGGSDVGTGYVAGSSGVAPRLIGDPAGT
jgi:hypothetical protein